MAKTAKYVDFVSPRGTAKYPKLTQPFSWNQSENRSVPDPDGQYEMTLLMTAEDASVLKKKVDEASSLAGIKPKSVPFKKEMDKDTEKETGLIEVKFKAYGKKKDGSVNRVAMFDAKKAMLPTDFVLTSGSVVKASGYISVAKLGARLNLRAIQVIDYVEPVADNPFEEEDGFVNNENNGSHNEEADEGDYDF